MKMPAQRVIQTLDWQSSRTNERFILLWPFPVKRNCNSVQGEDVMNGFVKLWRGDVVFELMKTNPNAFLLLTIIALRARRTNVSFNPHSLKLGQALVGDCENYGLSQQQYRSAKKFLETNGLATFQPTNKGTLATLCGTQVFDINPEVANNPEINSPDTELTTRATTNEEAEEAEERSFRLRSASSALPPSFEQVNEFFLSLVEPEEAGERARRFIRYNQNRGWALNDWKSAARAMNESFDKTGV